MTSKDISNVEVLPEGTPLLGLRQGDHLLRFVVLGEGERYFAGLVIKPWLVQPLVYVDTFDAGLDALRLLMSGFLSLGFVVESSEIEESEQ